VNERYGNNPGNLKHRITFLLPPGSPSEDAWPTTEGTEFITVWAQIKTLKGNRVLEAAAIHMQNVKTFGCRYRADVNDKMRLRYKGIVYQIESLTNDDENNQWLTIMAQEVL
jgi:SPP1 family predicted phage head-tail adaptor